MSKKSLIITSIFLIVFPVVFQVVIRGFWEPPSGIEKNTLVLADIISVIVLCAVFGRLYCGTLCQIGALQRLLNWAGAAVLKRRFEIPQKADKYLRLLKYAFLAGIAAACFLYGRVMFNPYMPFNQFSYLLPGIVAIPVVLVAATVAGGILFNNFFCKYLCIQGAINSLAGSFSALRIGRNKELCVSCKKCTNKCPANLPVHDTETVKSRECLYCQSCIHACPKKGVLGFVFFGRRMPYPAALVAIFALYVLTGIAMRFVLAAG